MTPRPPVQHSNFSQDLKAGQEFEDFVARGLFHRGIVLVNYTSKRFQRSEGENTLGLEIKFDRKRASAGNLYIETHTRTANGQMVKDGIYRQDHCWLFGIGDYLKFYIFGKRMLQRLDEHLERAPGCAEKVLKNGTGRGFLMSEAVATGYAELIIDWAKDAEAQQI